MVRDIYMHTSYFESFDQLAKQDRKIIMNAMKKFATENVTQGFKIHKLEKENCDDSFRSARMNQNLRLIFSQQGDKIIFLYVGNHDEAYDWAKNKYFHNSDYNSAFIYDSSVELKHQEKKPEDLVEKYQKGVLESQGISVEDLDSMGVPKSFAKILLKSINENEFLELISVLPDELQEALLNLYVGSETVESVKLQLTDKDITKENALEHKNAKSRFYKIEGENDVDRLLSMDFEKWKVFLHPKQEELVKKNYNGPALIEGGPGTGKTVVGMHRAVHLSKYEYPYKSNERILFCTFSRKLSAYVEEKVNHLIEMNGIASNIEVKGVDSLIFSVLKGVKSVNLSTVPRVSEKMKSLFIETYNTVRPSESIDFYRSEFTEVIQKNNIKTFEEYSKVRRTGQGKPLQKKKREEIWRFFDTFLSEKEKAGIVDFEDRAWILLEEIEAGRIAPLYASVIIDEAQDLSPVKLKVLSKLTKNNENGLFILSDQNQRIFQLNSWKNDTDINVVGRTHYLSLNYRTTREIKEYADKQFIQSSMEKGHIRNYRSLFGGPEPIVELFDDEMGQYSFVAKKIKSLIKQGHRAFEIGIITPKSYLHNEFLQYFDSQGIKCMILKNDAYPSKLQKNVSIVTLQGCKGLEFRVVFLLDAQEIYVQDFAMEEVETDYRDMKIKQMECLKYVALTRAREELYITSID